MNILNMTVDHLCLMNWERTEATKSLDSPQINCRTEGRGMKKRPEVCHKPTHEQREWMSVPRWKKIGPCFGWLSMFTLDIVTLYRL